MLDVRRFTSLAIFACALALAPASKGAAQEFPLYVAEYRGDGVYRLEADGTRTIRGFVPGPLNSVQKDADGNLYTCEETSPVVSRIDALGAVHVHATGFDGCFGLLLAPNGVLYVSNHFAGRIEAVPPGGGTPKMLASGLDGPGHMAFDTDGSILVTEFSGGRLSRVDASGGVSSVATGLDMPFGVAIGLDGNVYISEFLAGRLVRIAQDGKTSILAERGDAGPAGLAFHGDGRLFVAEMSAGRIVTIDLGTGATTIFRGGLTMPAGLHFDVPLAANRQPVAEAGTIDPVKEGSLVTLNGEKSFDPDDDPLTFTWIQLTGLPVALSGADTAMPSFTAPLLPGGPGQSATLTFQLTASDGALTSTDEVSVVIEKVNHPPVADAGPSQTVHSGSAVTLSGAGSSDPDGDPITYSWIQQSGPPASVENAHTATPSFVAPLVAGGADLVFRLEVSDGVLSATSTAVVSVANDRPRCDLAKASPEPPLAAEPPARPRQYHGRQRSRQRHAQRHGHGRHAGRAHRRRRRWKQLARRRHPGGWRPDPSRAIRLGKRASLPDQLHGRGPFARSVQRGGDGVCAFELEGRRRGQRPGL